MSCGRYSCSIAPRQSCFVVYTYLSARATGTVAKADVQAMHCVDQLVDLMCASEVPADALCACMFHDRSCGVV